jgi:hypothetical protein
MVGVAVTVDAGDAVAVLVADALADTGAEGVAGGVWVAGAVAVTVGGGVGEGLECESSSQPIRPIRIATQTFPRKETADPLTHGVSATELPLP